MPLTGRRHQLRVHCLCLGHPIGYTHNTESCYVMLYYTMLCYVIQCCDGVIMECFLFVLLCSVVVCLIIDFILILLILMSLLSLLSLILFTYTLLSILHLVGDYTYGADRELEKKSARMMLHAHHLKYVHYVHLLSFLLYSCIYST